jgi:hypothetical protein
MMMIIKQSFSGTQMMWKISQAPREALDQVSQAWVGSWRRFPDYWHVVGKMNLDR